jgi:Zn-dependent protease
MGLNEKEILERVMLFIPLVFSLSVHECAHAWTAWRLGDDTARLLGRLTLNPLAHIDPIGTLLLPLMGVPFGWAKPVPVNPMRFTRRINMQMGMLLVSVAGPLSNMAMALLSTVILGLLYRFSPAWLHEHAALRAFLFMMIQLNVLLAVFNLFPVPPLDGSRVADALMPRSLRPLWNEFYRLGPVALAALIIVPMLLRINLLSGPVSLVYSCLNPLLIWLAV